MCVWCVWALGQILIQPIAKVLATFYLRHTQINICIRTCGHKHLHSKHTHTQTQTLTWSCGIRVSVIHFRQRRKNTATEYKSAAWCLVWRFSLTSRLSMHSTYWERKREVGMGEKERRNKGKNNNQHSLVHTPNWEANQQHIQTLFFQCLISSPRTHRHAKSH